MKIQNQKKHTILLALLMMLIIPLTSCISNKEIRDDKAGNNGGFEIIKNGVPVNWYYTDYANRHGENNNENIYEVYSDSIDFIEGNRSLKFIVQKCTTKGILASPGIFEEFEAIPGADYTVSFWVKSKDSHFKIAVNAITVKGSSKEVNKDIFIESNESINEWKKYSVVRHIPNDLDRIRFDVAILTPGTFRIDGFKIEKN